MAIYKKNDVLNLTIEDLCGNGNALARDEQGYVIFVKNGVTGDRAKAKIIKVTKNYSVAIIDEIIEKSPLRIAEECEFSQKCGGCIFQNISYEAECEFKRKTIDNDIKRIAGLELRTSAFYPSDSICEYRNKASYPVSTDVQGKMISGFYARNSHRICEHDKCLIGKDYFVKVRDFVIDFCNKNHIPAYSEETGKGLLRHIYIRCTENDKFSLTLVINENKFVSTNVELEFVTVFTEAFSDCVTILLNTNKDVTNAILGETWRTIYGDGYIYDELLGNKFRISPASFYQVNKKQAEKLYSLAGEFANIQENQTILDLYCGTGTIGICLARENCKLYGVDISEEAIIDAKYNAEINDVSGEFIALAAGEALNSERIKDLKPDVIIIDPPRKGCGEIAVERIASLNAERIVYISCDPATLARDLKQFDELGYKATDAVGVDMFPRTGHVETVILLSRKDVYERIKFDVNVEDLQGRASSTATYSEIKAYILEKYGLKVSSLYIAQIKDKCGFEKRDNYNIGEGKSKELICPPEKEQAIMDAFRHFGMLRD